MAREPDMALFKTASGSLVRGHVLEDVSSKYYKTANTSGKAFQSYHRHRLQLSYSLVEHWLLSDQKILCPHTTPISNCMALMEIRFEI